MDTYNYYFGTNPDYFFNRLNEYISGLHKKHLQSQNIRKIQKILTYKFDLNKCSRELTPLGRILLVRDLDEDQTISLVKMLIEAGIEVNLTKSESTLSLALEKPHKIHLIELLLENGAKTDNLYYNKMATYNTEINWFYLIKLLLKYGWQVDQKDNTGCTLLYYTIRHYNKILRDILIETGADVNCVDADGEPLLFYAMFHRQIDSINALIKAGANTDIINNNKDTLLMYSLKAKYSSEIINLIIKNGADLNYTNPLDNMTILMLMVKLNRDYFEDLVLDLLQKNIFVEPSKINNRGYSAFTYSIKHSTNTTLIETLLVYCSDINMRTHKYFVHDLLLKRLNRNNSDLKIALLLFENGLDVGDNGEEFLLRVIKSSHEDYLYPLVSILLKDDRIRINRLKSDYTYLTAALRKNHYNYKIVELLLNYGADFTTVSYSKVFVIKKSFLSYLNLDHEEDMRIWNIIQSIIFTKKYYKGVIQSIPFVSPEFTSSPTSIKCKLMTVKWNLQHKTLEEVYEKMNKDKDMLLDYLGIDDLDTFKWKNEIWIENIE